jgi:hypothetical protein
LGTVAIKFKFEGGRERKRSSELRESLSSSVKEAMRKGGRAAGWRKARTRGQRLY